MGCLLQPISCSGKDAQLVNHGNMAVTCVAIYTQSAINVHPIPVATVSCEGVVGRDLRRSHLGAPWF